MLLAGWPYMPNVKDGWMQVEVQSSQGAKVQLTERSKMHYLDQGTSTRVLQDVWQNCSLVSGMSQDHQTSVLSHRKVLCQANTAKVKKAASIRFLEAKFNDMRQIVEARKAIEETKDRCRTTVLASLVALRLCSWEIKQIVV